MDKFVGRQRDFADLNAVLARPGSQFILVYGRRRVGKTTLILRWAEQTGRPVLYWVATATRQPCFAMASPKRFGPGPIPLNRRLWRGTSRPCRASTPGRTFSR